MNGEYLKVFDQLDQINGAINIIIHALHLVQFAVNNK